MKDKTGVVILNYNNYKDTIKCVYSLLNANYNNIEVVIVDNGSSNDSPSKLNEHFSNLPNVHFIILKKNIGYAKGNNIGISFLRKRMIDNIFIANSDLIFPKSPLFVQILEQIENNVGLLVPNIKNPNGSNDQRVIYKKRYFYLRMFKELIKTIIRNIISISGKNNINYKELSKSELMYKDCYVVSGSGFMLTSEFFKIYNGLFYDTFLYGEECGTIILLHKAKLTSKVVDTSPIIHLGGASTPDNIKNMTKKRRKIVIDSCLKLIKLLFSSPNKVKKTY